jgi:hypothetical protein
MTTYYLRFPDEAAGMAALASAALLTEDGAPIPATHTHALDVIGIISTGGEFDPESGEEIMPPTLLEGWHVNYIGALPNEWEEYEVTPASPVRVFAT